MVAFLPQYLFYFFYSITGKTGMLLQTGSKMEKIQPAKAPNIYCLQTYLSELPVWDMKKRWEKVTNGGKRG